MALVTKSPLYEDDVLVGVITISSDAAIFNSIKPENARTYQDRADVHNKERRFNLKKIPWLPKPQIASSVSNLASKVFSRQRGDDENDYSPRANGRNVVELGDAEDMEPTRAGKQPTFRSHIDTIYNEKKSKPEAESLLRPIQPSKIAAKFLQKLNIGEGDKEESQSTRVQSSFYYSTSNAAERASRYPIVSQKSSLERPDFRTNECEYPDCERIRNPNQSKKDSWIINKKPLMDSWLASQESRMPKVGNYMPQLGSEYYEKDEPVPDLDNLVEALEDKSKIHEKLEITQSPAVLISEESSGSSHENLTTKGDKFDCGILWEDLHLAEEVGQGSFAVVYRAIWNGSDVAVKVYIGSEYQEGTLLDYKKEVGIMQRLRHPNVLLFMGAVYSPERLAIVTEFLPRGSLFKTLHKSNQALDIKRRLRMALDVVRGMNYLHHRNPPILHRDLKSSNLLVDKNWTVKVGDFGLSKWKHATFVTAKSGRGTPQWMAPEVLRNEPSNEKSDVFSFGVILWELMTESIPWTQLNSLQVVGVVGFMDRRLEIPESLDPRLASIIHDCWQSEPNSRPSFKDLIPRVTDLIQTFPTVVPRKSPRS